jgi:hypothetical protein
MLTGTPPLPARSLNQASCSTTSHCATYFTATSLASPLAAPYSNTPFATAQSQSQSQFLHPIYAPPVHVTAEDRQGCCTPSAATIGKESSIGPSVPGLGSRGTCTQENSSNADVSSSLLSKVLEMQIALSVSPPHVHVEIARHHHIQMQFIFRSLCHNFIVYNCNPSVIASPSPCACHFAGSAGGY